MKNYLWIFVLSLAFLCPGTSILADESNYRIGAGDILEISVWKDETLNREVVVPPDSVISYPLIGDVDVSGMTVSGLRNAVTEKLSVYIPDAAVSVMIKEINSLKGYVIGKVNNPGEFNISMDTTVMQILAMARGLNPFASADKIHILRRKKNMTVKIPFNYKQLRKRRKAEPGHHNSKRGCHCCPLVITI